jgi:hypothetical protein
VRNQIDRLPELAANLVRRQVAVIATFANGAQAGQGGNNDDAHRLPLGRRPAVF